MFQMVLIAIISDMNTSSASIFVPSHTKHQASPSERPTSIHQNSQMFASYSDDVPIQVLERNGNQILHRHYLPRDEARWDIHRLARTLKGALLCCETYGDAENMRISKAVFGTVQRSFIHFVDGEIRLYAPSLARIRSMAKRLARYLIKDVKAKPEFGTYHLLRMSGNGIETFPVRMKPSFQLDSASLELHYGEEFGDWHGRFHAGLLSKDHGLTIFDGPPGTGKTSYLRHLMVQMRETHRFYFVPPSSVGIVSDPGFVDFWNREREEAQGQRFVMVLEDAEQALMSRGGDNRNEVSSILNITDGLLADFLQIQLICTINCGTEDIDSALLRPGRLFAQRTFGRLPYREAHLLAALLGKELPLMGDYSLAEIFAVDPIAAGPMMVPKIGFAA